MMGLGLGYQDYMMGGMNPYMMASMAMSPNAYLNFKNEDDMKSFYSSRVDDAQASVYANGQGRISQKTYAIAAQLKGALEEGDSSEVGEVLEKLKGDKTELAGVELAYDNLSGKRTALREDIRNGMGGSKFLNHVGLSSVNDFIQSIKKSVLTPFGLKPMSAQEGIDIINEGTTVNTTTAANALAEATRGSGTDKKTLGFVLNNANGRMGEINSSYNQMGRNLNQDIREGFNFFIDGPAAAEKYNTQIAGMMA